MGFFDLLTPTLKWVDESLFSILNIDLKIIIWSLIGAICSTLLFKSLVNTKKVVELKKELKKNQAALSAHEGSFDDLKSLAKTSITLSFKRLGATTLPSLAAAIPLVFLLVFMSSQYDLEPVKPNQIVPYEIFTSTEKTAIEQGTIVWPALGLTDSIKDSNGIDIVAVPFNPVQLIHKEKWWNVLFANPASYIPESSHVDRIVFNFKSLSTGPIFGHFFSTWHWPFIILISLFSLTSFYIFKIKF